ncbi:Mu transposase C-terminal domain-containing protein [Terasakiella pusilla]|uniref:Mu transposase C-terminal domain-containing protein n=1 Tax=Terasakiella pusilla TaxID=64973 RepID=UPI003AA9C7DA
MNNSKTLDPSVHEEAKRRFDILKKYRNRTHFSLEEITLLSNKLKLSPSQTRKVLRRFLESGGLNSLFPRRPGPKIGTRKLKPVCEKIIREKIYKFYASLSQPSILRLSEEITAECIKQSAPIPNINTIRARLKDADAELIAKKRYGIAKGHSRRGTAFKRHVVQRPLQEVQIDHTPVDIILLSEDKKTTLGRPYLTIVEDVYSRMVLGYYLSMRPPSSLSVALALLNAIWPKNELLDELGIHEDWCCHGVPYSAHNDNAKEFRSHSLRIGCEEFGIILTFRPVKKSWFGGHVERLLGTINSQVHQLPGTTKSNPLDRGEYDSAEHAKFSFKEFERWLILQILKYHHSDHQGLGRIPPISMWKMACDKGFSPETVGDKKHLYLTFLPFETRTVSREGIRLFNIHYVNTEIERYSNHLGKKVIVKYDPRNLAKVWVYFPNKNVYEFHYRNPGNPNISKWELEAIRKKLIDEGRARVSEEALFQIHKQQREIERSVASQSSQIESEPENVNEEPLRNYSPKTLDTE